MLQHAVAEIGDGELARGAQQQAFAELRFESAGQPDCKGAVLHRQIGSDGLAARLHQEDAGDTTTRIEDRPQTGEGASSWLS